MENPPFSRVIFEDDGEQTDLVLEQPKNTQENNYEMVRRYDFPQLYGDCSLEKLLNQWVA